MSEFYFNTTFARLFFALSFGIIAAEYSTIHENIFLAILVVGLSLSIFSTLQGRRFGGWIFIFSWGIFLFGSGGYLLRYNEVPNEKNAFLSNHNYIVEVKTPPIDRGRFYRSEVEILYAEDSLVSSLIGHRILLYIESDSLQQVPELCDRYLLNMRINSPSDNGLGGFDYGKYLHRNGLCGVSYVYSNNIKFLDTKHPTDIVSCTYKLREKLLNRFEIIGIKGESLAILSAVTLGEKGYLPTDMKETFSAAGVSHILVVSGMHVGFIFLIILLILKRIPIKIRWLIVVLGLIILWGYALLTGLAPSVVRATFMFSMILIFRELGEKYRVEHALFFSAMILLLCNPNTLFNVGFQLSYLAVGGIVYFYPLICKILIPKSKILKWLSQCMAVTISAQMLTFPIVIYNFNQFPIFFIVSNIVVTLFAPIIFIGGILLLPLSFVSYIGEMCGVALNYILEVFNLIIDGIVALPFSSTKVYLSLLESILLYLVVICIINWIEVRKVYAERFKGPLYLALSICLFMVVVTVNNINLSKQEKLIIPDTNHLIVNVFNKKSNLLFTNQVDFACERLEHIWLKYSVEEPIIISDTILVNNIFKYNDRNYLVLRDNVFRYRQNKGEPLDIDCLIIDRGVYPSERLFKEFLIPKQVILTAGVWSGYIEQFKVLFNKNNIAYYIIAEDGTFVD